MSGVSARTLTLLGSTGSIGTQAIDVVRAHPDRFVVRALVLLDTGLIRSFDQNP